MRIRVVKSSTTAGKTNKKVLNVLARCASSTSYQSSVLTSVMRRGTGATILEHSPSTRDYTSTQQQIDAEEVEWDTIVSTPHVQRGLRRMAAEARRQIAAGKIEEGGFAVE